MPDGEGRRLRAPTIHWVWRAFNLQPHRTEISELSADPVFVEKVRDIVGLDLSPPERAVVLCVDEKSQIQALDRSQRLLPIRPGQSVSGARTTLHAIERSLCSRRSMLLRERSLDVAIPITADGSFSACCARSNATSRPNSMCTFSRTTTPPTKRRRSKSGSARGGDGKFTSRPPPVHGPIKSSASSQTSPKSRSAAASIAPRQN